MSLSGASLNASCYLYADAHRVYCLGHAAYNFGWVLYLLQCCVQLYPPYLNLFPHVFCVGAYFSNRQGFGTGLPGTHSLLVGGTALGASGRSNNGLKLDVKTGKLSLWRLFPTFTFTFTFPAVWHHSWARSIHLLLMGVTDRQTGGGGLVVQHPHLSEVLRLMAVDVGVP